MRRHLVAVSICSMLVASACASTTEPDAGASASADTSARSVTVVTHDSFAIPEDVVTAFERESGIDVSFVGLGDAGSLVNKVILTKDAPLGDVVFGIDNTFASRALDAGVLAEFAPQSPAAGNAEAYAIDETDRLTAIDVSDVCLNIDLAYFDEHDLAAPTTFDDLLRPEYSGLLSIANPATSSPGLALLLATISAKGDAWPDYWEALKENGLRVTTSWSDTYYSDFSAPNYGGDYPIVLSYASSPPFEVVEGEPTTAALLDTCFRQVEYAGILEGTSDAQAAGEVIDWMLSDSFQREIPTSMYVYPVSSAVEVPADWAQLAPLAPQPWSLSPQEIAEHRDEWIGTWTGIVEG